MKKITALVLFISLQLLAQSAGETGLSFLKKSYGARAAGMGDLGSLLGSDVAAMFYNPALLNAAAGPQVLIMHNGGVEGLTSEVLGVQFSLFGTPVAVGFNSASVSGIEIRTRPGDAEGTFNAHFFSASLAAGFTVTPELQVGVAAKLLYEGMYADEANGAAVDISAAYALPLHGVGIVASVRNLGAMGELKNESTKLPAELRISPVYSFRFSTLPLTLGGGVEYQQFFSGSGAHVNAGAEAVYDNLLALRLGYRFFYDAFGFTAGAGITYSGISFDYAVTPYSFSLGTGHTVSLKYIF